MSALQTIPTMSPKAIDKVRELEARLMQEPQAEVVTHHVLHAGLYARTVLIPAGAVITGAEIKRATTLVIAGHVRVFDGDHVSSIAGYQVVPASAGRKQAFVAIEDTHLTMLFATQAKTVAEAEAEFTDEVDLLMSRHGKNIEIVTGE